MPVGFPLFGNKRAWATLRGDTESAEHILRLHGQFLHNWSVGCWAGWSWVLCKFGGRNPLHGYSHNLSLPQVGKFKWSRNPLSFTLSSFPPHSYLSSSCSPPSPSSSHPPSLCTPCPSLGRGAGENMHFPPLRSS